MVKMAPRFDTTHWLTLHDAAAHEAYGHKQGAASVPPKPEEEILTIGRFTINYWERTISQGDKTIQLYDKQWRLFAYLVGHYEHHKSGYVTKEQMLNDIWDGIGSTNLVRITIWRLREKLQSLNADVMIENIPGSSRYRLRVRRIKV
jgi:DNA-binding response OmpR family regulator